MKINNNLQKNRFQMLFTDDLYNLQNDIFSVVLPDLTLSSFQIDGYGGTKYRKSGNDFDFGQLIITIKINDDMSNLDKFYDWMYEILDPVTGKSQEKYLPGTLQIYGSNGKVLKEFEFTDLVPVSITGVEFTSNISETDFELAQVTFDLSFFKPIKK